MCTLSRCILVTSIVAVLVSTAACDSTSVEEPPSLNGIQSESELLMFRPGDPLPTTALFVDAPAGDDVTFHWNASGGIFESTGTPRDAQGRAVTWQPAALGGTYVISVEARRGGLAVHDSTSIEVQPRPFGNWSRTIALTNEEYDVARMCMFISGDHFLSQYDYSESRTSGGTTQGGGSGGGVLDSRQSYEYPTLNADLGEPDTDDFDDPVALTGTLTPDGQVFAVEVELESGKMRSFELLRTAFYCQ